MKIWRTAPIIGLIRKKDFRMKTCDNCRHYFWFLSVCTNWESEYWGDFVLEEENCEKWEAVKNE